MTLLRAFLLVVFFALVPLVAVLAYDWQGTLFPTLYSYTHQASSPFSALDRFTHNQKLAAGIVIGFVGWSAGMIFLFTSYAKRRSNRHWQ